MHTIYEKGSHGNTIKILYRVSLLASHPKPNRVTEHESPKTEMNNLQGQRDHFNALPEGRRFITSICTRRRIMGRGGVGGFWCRGWDVISEVPTISKGRGHPAQKRERKRIRAGNIHSFTSIQKLLIKKNRFVHRQARFGFPKRLCKRL
ncbi:hypothetical protein CDAR_564351 [Caerostris darwini]|uniref:Uncharacterized protein n=1 Tax=Caerostris darwini TaxID=1538125 RepID=A0AAV4TJP1_9ARAC|nr:hypothetical protein CDAR_564351 [Caerostris darwini]